MKRYKVTRVRNLYEIEFEVKDDKELMKLYQEGVVDEHLSKFDEHEHYLITDEDGKVIFEHKYT